MNKNTIALSHHQVTRADNRKNKSIKRRNCCKKNRRVWTTLNIKVSMEKGLKVGPKIKII